MADLEQARRIVELMVLTAWADGRVEGVEALAIHKLTLAFPQLRGSDRYIGASVDIIRVDMHLSNGHERLRSVRLSVHSHMRGCASALRPEIPPTRVRRCRLCGR